MKIEYKFMNLNDTINACRTNPYKANNLKKAEMEAIKLDIAKMKVVKNYPIGITFNWHFKDKRKDLDNQLCKNLLDQMVKMGKLKNDNLNCIQELHHIAIIDGNEYVEIEIKELQDERNNQVGE